MGDLSNSGVSLSLAGAVFTVISTLIVRFVRNRFMAVMVAGYGICLVSFVGILGYIFETPTMYTYPPSGVPMALPSCVIYLTIGITNIIIAGYLREGADNLAAYKLQAKRPRRKR